MERSKDSKKFEGMILHTIQDKNFMSETAQFQRYKEC